ncbi:MAG: hypothetical protein ACKOE2_04615, partial [Actinomycetales bacterium]
MLQDELQGVVRTEQAIAGIGTSFVALNSIEMALAEIVGAGRAIDRRQQALTLNDLDQLVRPGDTVLDATGRNSLTRDG